MTCERKNPKTRLVALVVLAAWIGATLMATGATAEVGDLFATVPGGKVSMLDAPAVAEAWRVAIDPAVLDRAPESVSFALPDGKRFAAQIWDVEKRGAGNVAWRGRLADGGQTTLTLKNGYVMGVIETATATWELTSIADGSQVLVRLDFEEFGSCAHEFGDVEDTPLIFKDEPTATAARPGVTTKMDPANSVDIMTVYTPQAQAGAGGTAAIEATAQSAVDVSNTAFANSGMDIRWNLVHSQLIDRNDANNASADRNFVRADPTVQAFRDVFRADMVGMLVESAGPSLCGIAFLMGNESAAAFSENGYQVTQRNCAVGNRTFAHEHGHNMGLQHNPQAGAPASQAFRTFAFGHFVNGNYRTVMAAASSPCPNGCTRVGRFSNPNIVFQGAATGISNQRDNARTSNITAPFVANWRERFPAPSACADCLDFDNTATVSYSNQDNGTGPVAVRDNGDTFALGGNRWRRSNQTFTINADSVLEFEFLSTVEGEIHAIGFDEDDTLTNDTRVFQLFGTQTWASAFQDNNNYTNGQVGTFVSYSIPVGQFYTGSGFRLVLVNDKDAAGQNNTSFFRNVRLTDDGGPPPPGDCAVDDDFENGAAGWTNNGAATCTTGAFVLATPTQQTSTVVTQVGGDNTSGTGNAIFTATNTSAGNADVDGGECILTSPTFNVTDASELEVFYFHGQRDAGDDPGDDFFVIEASVNGGGFQPFVSIGDVRNVAAWTRATRNVPANSTVVLQVRVSDGAGPSDIVEGGIDDLSICSP